MDALDFSALTDDQLVELIRAGLQEVVRRGPIAEAAARAACLDEQEKATIAAQAAAAERDRVLAEERRRVAEEAAAAVRREAEAKRQNKTKTSADKLWEEKDAVGRKLRELLAAAEGEPVVLKVWSNYSGEKRVYLSRANYDAGCVFVTGNARSRPKSIELKKRFADQVKPREAELIALCVEVASRWNRFEVIA